MFIVWHEANIYHIPFLCKFDFAAHIIVVRQALNLFLKAFPLKLLPTTSDLAFLSAIV